MGDTATATGMGKPRRLRRLEGGRRRAVLVRLSDAEFDRLVTRAARAGVSPPRFLVERGLADPARVVERRAAYAMFMSSRRDLDGMGTNLNQLAKVANSTGRVPDGLVEAIEAVARMEEAVVAAAEAVQAEMGA